MDAADPHINCPSCGAQAPVGAPYCPSCGESLDIPATVADGRFELRRLLGKGGMGRVFQATDTRLSAERAIKLLSVPADISEDQRTQQIGRLIQEARASMALSDDTHHVVRVFDVGESGEQPYLVMEFLDGQSVSAALADGPLPVERALRISKGIAHALACAHERGMVHRDLKPDNVMLISRGGSPDFAKLLDFGLVKLRDAEVKTQTGVAVGTLQYMAPEQLRGLPADTRVDVFAFGAILYEMLSGIRANPGTSQAELFAVLLDRGVDPLQSRCPELDPRLLSLVDACLQLDPDARPANGQMLLQYLEALTEHSAEAPTDAEPISSSEEHAVSMGSVGEIPTVSVETVSEPSASNSRGLWIALAAVIALATGFGWWSMDGAEPAGDTPKSSPLETTSAQSASAVAAPAVPDAGPAEPAYPDGLPPHPTYTVKGDPSGWHYTGASDDDVFAGLVLDLAFGPQTAGRKDRWAALPSVVRYWLSIHFNPQRPTQGKAKLDIGYSTLNRLRKRLVSPIALRGLGQLWSSQIHGAIFESVNCSQLKAGDKLVTTRWSMRGYSPGECKSEACPEDLARILKQSSTRGERVTFSLGVERSETDSGKTKDLTVDCTVRP